METVNRVLNFVFDLLLLEFLGLPPFWGLASLSALFAVGALLVFKRLSNQKGIRAAKDKVMAYLLQVILFQDDVRTVLRAQGKVLRYNFVYLGHNLVPMVFLVLPFILVVMNLDPRFRFDPVRTGEPTYVSVTLREGTKLTLLERANLAFVRASYQTAFVHIGLLGLLIVLKESWTARKRLELAARTRDLGKLLETARGAAR